MTDKFKFYLTKELKFSNLEAIKIIYMLKLIFLDLSKLCLLYLIFSHYGQENFFLSTSLFTILTRLFLGGTHMKTYLTCFVVSLAYYSLIFYVSSLAFSTVTMACFGLISIIIILMYAPVIPKQRQSLNYNRKIMKIKGLLFSFIIVMLFLTYSNDIFTIGILVIYFQSLSIFLKEGYHVIKN